MPNAQLESPAQKRPLVLHFDIRNTVIVTDSTNNVSIEQALNSYLTSVAWGTVDASGNWQWLDDQPVPSLQRPCSVRIVL